MNDRAENNLIADFCGYRTLVQVMVAMVLLAIVMLLVPGQSLSESLESLGLICLFLFWLGLLSLAVLCLSSRLLRKLPLSLSVVMTFVLIQMVTLAVSEGAYQLAANIELLRHLLPQDHPLFLLRNTAISIIISGVALYNMYLQRQLQLRIAAENHARIMALQARIRPHFLFNSMNTIAALTRLDAAAAEQAVLDLSDIYRAALKTDVTELPLAQELELVRHYLAVEKLRLGERLRVCWDIDETANPAMVPALLLQPLVENAVYHGIEVLPAGGEVSISTSLRHGVLQVSVQNPVADGGSVHAGNQEALLNIAERLQLTFAGRARMQTASENNIYRVDISIEGAL